MIYAILHYSFKGNAYKIYALCLLLGIIGYLFGMYKINIPFYLDTSLTCMPFVCAGVIIRENTTFLTNNNNKIYNLALSLICFLVVYLSCRGVNMFYENTYANNYSVVLLTGICGSLGVILLCKTIVKLPIISYMGRYSIIVLGVHAIIINEMEGFFPSKFTQIVYWEIITFVVTIIISCALIHLFTKYIPFFVAQKDFIQFTFLKKQ